VRKRHFDNFDIICTNPPYVPTGYIDSKESSLGFEPRQALDGGADGLRCIIRILNEAPEWLKPGGMLLMEIGHDQSERLEYYLKNMAVYTGIRFIKDLQGIPRILCAEIGNKDTKK
jgi:release factor glutamine methyltransferase